MNKDDSILVEAEVVSEEVANGLGSPWGTVFRKGRRYFFGMIIGTIGVTFVTVGIAKSVARILYPQSPKMVNLPKEWIWVFWAIPFLGMIVGVIVGNRRQKVLSTGTYGNREMLAAGRGMLRYVMIFQVINAFVGFLGFALFHWIVTGVTVFVIASGLRLSVITQIVLNIGIAILAFPEWTLLAAGHNELFSPLFLLVKLVTIALVICVLQILLRAAPTWT